MNKKKPIDILQGKFKHFTGDVELDDENGTPFRVKKVGNKYEYDFVTYDEWDKMMTDGEDVEYDFEGSLDDFEIWLKNWKPNIEEKDFNPKMIKMKELLNLKEIKYGQKTEGRNLK